MIDVITTSGMSINIPTESLREFRDHPYKLHEGPEMEELQRSIQEKGVLTPLIVWYTEQGYTVISGHRRLHACRALGIETVPAIVCDVTWAEAARMVVDCNLHRQKLLPSEMAYAYKLELAALRHQGQRRDLVTSDQTDRMFDEESAAIIARKHGKSVSDVRRCIRLTHLQPELLQMVDEGTVRKTAGVHLSHLTPEEQGWMLDVMRTYSCKPTSKQAEVIKAQSKAGTLTRAYIIALLTTPADQEITQIEIDDLRPYFPSGYTNGQIYSAIIRLCQDQA